MFEFHGWATICVDDTDDPDLSVLHARENEAVARLRVAMSEADDRFSLIDLKQLGNGLIVLLVHGLRNHRYEPVIELFRWVAVELPCSYGLLYVQDDEDHDRDADYENEFRVWRLALGTFEECADPFLSPRIPTVEPPWEWPTDPEK